MSSQKFIYFVFKVKNNLVNKIDTVSLESWSMMLKMGPLLESFGAIVELVDNGVLGLLQSRACLSPGQRSCSDFLTLILLNRTHTGTFEQSSFRSIGLMSPILTSCILLRRAQTDPMKILCARWPNIQTGILSGISSANFLDYIHIIYSLALSEVKM